MAAEFKVPAIPERFRRCDGIENTKNTDPTTTSDSNEIASNQAAVQECSDLSKLAPPGSDEVQDSNGKEDVHLLEPDISKGEALERSEPAENGSSRPTARPGKEALLEAPELSYIEPRWGGKPASPHSLTVIKNGAVVDEIDISEKAHHVFGRLPTCDIPMDHPSISRFHTVLQCRPQSSEKVGKDDNHTLFSTEPLEAGFYVYDLGSTHGTFLNKTRIQPRCYYRVRVGQMIRLGGSSRLYVLEQDTAGSQEYIEEQAEEERREIVRQKEAYLKQLEAAKEEKERREKEVEEMGVSWGMMMDDVPPEGGDGSGEELEVDPEREAYYKDDPKKALHKFFEREGLELEYETEETGTEHSKSFTCRVRLPIDTATGEPVYADATTGKKKEAVVQCALNACRLLESQGMLRRQPQGHKRKAKTLEENDYYDSDEDNFLDRTGDVEKKRKQRMKRVGKAEDVVENYQSLMTKLGDVQDQIATLEDKLEKAKAADSTPLAGDSLDTYMTHVDHHLDSAKQAEFKHQVHELKKEEERLSKLARIAKPASIPSSLMQRPTTVATKQTLPLGKLDRAGGPGVPLDRAGGPGAPLDRAGGPGAPLDRAGGPGVPLDRADGPGAPLDRAGGPGVPLDRAGRLVPKIPTPSHAPDHTPNDACKSEDVGAAKTSLRVARQRRTHKAQGPMPQAPVRNEPMEEDEDEDGHRKPKEKPQWEGDPDYSSWLPPDDQQGDGKTRLNEKFGY